MYYKLNEYEQKLIEMISNETSVNYELIGDFFPMESFIPILEDLWDRFDVQREKYNDLKEDLKENYRPITNKELYGDCEDYR